MQMVGRRVLAIAFSLASLAVFSSRRGRPCSERTNRDGRCDHERGCAGNRGARQRGLWLRGLRVGAGNWSLTRDAIDVTVEVEAVDGRGQAITDGYTTVTLIPAGADFVISGALIWRGSPELAGIETEVHVGQTAPRRRRLPPVKHVSVTSSGRVIGSFTNPYKKPLPAGARSTVLFSTAGGESWRRLRPHRRSHSSRCDRGVRHSRGVDNGAARRRHLRQSVSRPCGYLAFTRVCPVPGARS